MRTGKIETLDSKGEMSNLSLNDLQHLHSQIQQKDQIIDRLTRMLARQSDTPPVKAAANDEKVIPIDVARRFCGR